MDAGPKLFSLEFCLKIIPAIEIPILASLKGELELSLQNKIQSIQYQYNIRTISVQHPIDSMSIQYQYNINTISIQYQYYTRSRIWDVVISRATVPGSKIPISSYVVVLGQNF